MRISRSMVVFVAIMLIAFPTAASAVTLPLIHTMDTLEGLEAGIDTEIWQEDDPAFVFEGLGAVRMEWFDEGGDDRGYFDWILPEDPDASEWQIQFQIYPPRPMREISLELVDSQGRVAEGWFWNVRESWYDRYNTLTAVVGDQSGADRHVVGPGNITQVERVRFDERSGGGWSLNFWDYTIITPEPSSAALLICGVLLARMRRSS